jgi:hypothetical protein
MSKIIYDPLGIFEQNPAKGGVCELKEKVVTLTAATANQTVVAAVTGKSIVVLEGNLYSEGTAATVNFLNGSGGSGLKKYYIPANTLAEPNVQLPRVEWGLMRTTAGTGLFATTSGGAAVVVSITYIEVSA